MNFACIKCFESNDENDENCFKCNTPLNLPLTDFPKNIANHEVSSAIGRGFYGITYVAKDFLDQEIVLKVIPEELYKEKNFEKECKLHAEICKGTAHLVGIRNIMSGIEVSFGTIKHNCHVSILNFIKGQTLKKIINDKKTIKVETITQIAIDLLNILDVLHNKKIHHNDLHPDNIMIEELNNETRRSGEIDNLIRVVAIDLGSISVESKSDNKEDRINDIHWIAKYIKALSDKLLLTHEKTDDRDFRVAISLEKYSKMLLAPTANSRVPNYEEIIESIKETYQNQTTSWKDKKFVLKNIGQYYNAQQLDSWNIPDLFVEEAKWLSDVSAHGPLVITGMRGCGKTMLLKSMQIHARIKQAHSNSKPISMLQEDGFIGLYINSNRLLDKPGISNSIHEPLSKLFVAYGIEAINALKHLKEIDFEEIKDDYYLDLLEVYKNYIIDLEEKNITSVNKLERELHKILIRLNNNNLTFDVPNPVHLFPQLAKGIQKACKSLQNHYILFLLDDVSTRYLSMDNIRNLFSSLIFHDEYCAFKFTSEIQTMTPLLHSPGLIEKAKIGRDIETFDLGEKVYEKTKGTSGKKFVLQILNKRKKYTRHPDTLPEDLLGDISLKHIAENIIGLPKNKLKNEIYHGLSALTGVCVGDIGDVILLYKNILEKRKNDIDIPIPAKDQHTCFLELSNQRLHDLKKRTNNIDKYALSFAEASNSLLIDSSKKVPLRLREYASIYINNTTGNTDEQYAKIREMIDAGIFVLLKGAKNLRTPGKGNNPINQFILLYRKILGLSKLIGLSQSDRFELSGEHLKEWLNSPTDGYTILKKSVEKQYGQEKIEDKIEEESISTKVVANKQKKQYVANLFDLAIDNPKGTEENSCEYNSYSTTKKLLESDIKKANFDILITSLGFEERAFESLRKCISLNKPKKIILVKYSHDGGFSKNILDYVKTLGIDFIILSETKTLEERLIGNILIDISGMNKSSIFCITSIILKAQKSITIAHTFAKEYAPSEEKLKPFFENLKKSQNRMEVLDKITENVSKGEELLDGVEKIDLLNSDVDETRNRILLGLCNVKYEKLFQLIEEREFETIDIFVSKNQSMKHTIASIAAEMINISYPEVYIDKEDTDDLNYLINSLTDKYYKYYIDQSANIEIALSGHKLYSVACAVINSRFKVAHCWYLSSNNFDQDEFSKGFAETEFFEISLT